VDNRALPANTSNFLLYTAAGKIKIEVFLKHEPVWLTPKSMGELFHVQHPAITKHLKNFFESRELQKNSVGCILKHSANYTYNR